ncbi:acyltransferase family protein [Microvirga solisilvae]|uniref:acyltransferase family protein n=1 Tax=Microvirga solisilvae TaxID=2919498 RepID=UPI001FB00A22|nr:acyltransferase [Microvirga solisilvae]
MSKLIHIQILRACAALAVAIHHAQFDAAALAGRFGGSFHPFEAIPWAAGVDIFFVISGFIIVYSSQKLAEAPGAAGVFLTRRLGRVVPLYWSATGLYLALALAVPGVLNSEVLEPGFILASYLFIPLARPDGLVQPLYSLGWTLNYEIYFYLLFAMTLAWPLKRSVPVLITVMAATVALGRFVTLPLPLSFWTNPIVLEFAFGMMLGLLKVEGFTLSRAWRGALFISGLGLLVVWAHAGLPRAIAYGLPAALLVAAAALGAERLVQPTGWFVRVGSALGDASYALYLVHPFVIRAGREVVVRSGLGTIVGGWGYIALVLAGAVVASLMIFRWYESPLTEWIRQRLETRRLRVA